MDSGILGKNSCCPTSRVTRCSVPIVGGELDRRNTKQWITIALLTLGCGGDVIVWGMFCWYGIGPLILLDVGFLLRLSERCFRLIHHAMLNFFSIGEGCFINDKATVHLVRIVQERFSKHDCHFHHLPWPP